MHIIYTVDHIIFSAGEYIPQKLISSHETTLVYHLGTQKK